MKLAEPARFADELCTELVSSGFGPFLGTPCGILAPLYTILQDRAGLQTITREDNAIGVAVGAYLAGRSPVVLMQNSGLAQSVNALASLVIPFQIPIAMVVGWRGIAPDFTPENTVMGRLTESLLSDLGISVAIVEHDSTPSEVVKQLYAAIHIRQRAAALLIPPNTFGWQT